MFTHALTPVSPVSPAALPPRRLADIARNVAARKQLWEPLIRFDASNRWYSRLIDAPDYEVWLLTWLPGQGTEIHDHGGSAGAFVVTAGKLTERSYHPQGRPLRGHRTVPAGAARAFHARHIHDVANAGPAPAVSIHAYSPALSTMSYYRHWTDGRLELVRTDRVDNGAAT